MRPRSMGAYQAPGNHSLCHRFAETIAAASAMPAAWSGKNELRTGSSTERLAHRLELPSDRDHEISLDGVPNLVASRIGRGFSASSWGTESMAVRGGIGPRS